MTAADLLDAIRRSVPYPATVRELLHLLEVPREERAAVRRLLRALAAGGALVATPGRRYALRERLELVHGRVESHPAGHAFVVPDRDVEGLTGDVIVPPHLRAQAMHGDRVVARIDRRPADGRAEGRIVEVIERRAQPIVGRFEAGRAGGAGVLVPFDRRLGDEIRIPRGETGGAEPGAMVTVELVQPPTPSRPAVGRVVEVLGRLDEPGVDTEIILRKYGIPDAHSSGAVTEARRLGSAVRERDLKGRTDFRDRLVVTIDGEHARDFDDAVSVERLADGHWRLGVHIADVAHYVGEGSALDLEAYERGTSVYFPERAVHMFPPELATGVCSLNPHVDRLVQSVIMDVNRAGEVVHYELHDGVIHSAARMTYTDVNAMLADRDASVMARYRELVPTFELMRELFEVLNRRRRARGSIDFDLPEPEVILDTEGFVADIVPSERNIAHRIIEEFMLLANETVAAHLAAAGMPALYRIHERPDPLKVEQFEAFVASLGYSLGAPPDRVHPRDFQRLLDRVRGRPEEKPIAFLMLRTMQKARYDPINVGHFGLAARTYTHFTSPIRRYPDLVVHRALRELRAGGVSDERREELDEELAEIARHASEMERRADEAERELIQWKKVRFMADKVGDVFDGYVTGVSPFGLFVELSAHFVEGLVHVSTLADDHYRYREQTHTLTGERRGRVFRLGDRVAVQVLRVDLDRRQIDLGIADVLEAVRRDPAGAAARRRPPKAAGGTRRRAAGARGGAPRRRARPGRRERAGRRRR